MAIHPFAVVDPTATIGANVEIGPFAIVEAGVVIGDRTVVDSYAIIKSGTTLGPDNHVFERATIGGLPQHTNMPPHVGGVTVGAGNTIREGVTIHRALHDGHSTVVGDHNLLMVGTHVAHDCHVGSNTIFANNATLGGHVVVEDRAYVSGNAAVHQFCRIGRMAMVGGVSKVVKDVPPYCTVDGAPCYVVGLNTVGLRRSGLTPDEIATLKQAYRVIYRSSLKWSEILERLQTEYTSGPAAYFASFMSQTSRGIVAERRLPPGASVKLTEEAGNEPILRVKAG